MKRELKCISITFSNGSRMSDVQITERIKRFPRFYKCMVFRWNRFILLSLRSEDCTVSLTCNNTYGIVDTEFHASCLGNSRWETLDLNEERLGNG